MMVCDTDGMELLSIDEFVVKYLELINREKMHIQIVNRLKMYPGIRHIAKIKIQ